MKTKMNETKVVCPKCGTEFEIADKTRVGIGIVIGKDSCLGTIHPKVAGEDKHEEKKLPKKAVERIEALRAAGVDVSNYYAMNGANGGEFLFRNDETGMHMVSDDDPVYDAILYGGELYNSKLARRWVMGQEFRMLSREGVMKYGVRMNSITDQIRSMGHEYQWKMLERELYAQYKMARNGDDGNYKDRSHWFNKNVVYEMLYDYLKQLKKHVKYNVKQQKCKGVPYKRILGENVFVEDIESKVYMPVERLMEQVRKVASIKGLYDLVHQFNCRIRKERGWNPSQSSVWIGAYKGAGAFFTMQNMIRYHKCRFTDGFGNRMSKDASYVKLQCLAKEYKGEGWRMLGVLRQFIKDNGIDIDKKMAEWRKK